MPVPFVRHTFGVIVIVVLALTAFRIATAPERIAERRQTARSVCLAAGGQWITEGRTEYCRRRGAPTP